MSLAPCGDERRDRDRGTRPSHDDSPTVPPPQEIVGKTGTCQNDAPVVGRSVEETRRAPLVAQNEARMADQPSRFRGHDAHQVTTSELSARLPKGRSDDDGEDPLAQSGFRECDGFFGRFLIHRRKTVPVFRHVEKLPTQ